MTLSRLYCSAAIVFVVVLVTASTTLAAPDRVPIDRAFRDELNRLAAKCDELKFPDQAAITRGWLVERLPDRQTIFLPPDAETVSLPASAPVVVTQWRAKFLELRRAQAEKLFALAREYLAADQPTKAYQTLYEVLRENPDHALARKILGYRQLNNSWRLPGASPAARRATIQHTLVKSFTPRNYWRVSTPHFSISTNTGSGPGLQFGQQLEELYTVWRQVFFRYWSTDDDLKAAFDDPGAALPLRPAFEVVLLRHRADYLAALASAEPRLAVTQGIYLDKQKTAFFYLGDDRADAIANHEVTHQLFQETGHVAPEIGASGNFWIVEGLALYMESLRRFENQGQTDYVTLGGWDADRLQFARHHVFNGQFQMPLGRLVAATRESLQRDEDIKRIYSQSAGMAQFLMDADSGKHREAAVSYISNVYAGRDNAQTLAALTGQSLESLDAAYREFLRVKDEDVERMPAPSDVQNLCLGHQDITDASLSKIATCQNLRWLDLAKAKVTDKGLAHLAALKNLEQLNLEQTAAGDPTLKTLGKLTRLAELDLSHTQATDPGVNDLGALTDLRVLWLTGTSASDAVVHVLMRLKKLETLDLEQTKISPEAQRRLRSSLPHLTPNH
jgi:hypothetical protein